MCGIAGYYDQKGVDPDTLIKMNKILSHRGPDDEGIWKSDYIGFAHTRLSIIDLSQNGRQPMQSQSGRYTIVFNGEIYNHREIRKNIPIKWNSSTDTETLIESIQYFGLEQTLKKIEGMFAFALYDKKKDQLFLVRDPLGQKPLYYGHLNNKFFFASELKAFKAIQGLDLKINRNSLSSFIKSGYIECPYSIYKKIYKLKPGYLLNLQLYNELSPRTFQYYDLKSIISSRKITTHIDSKLRLKEILIESITKQQLSDVPIGSFLSGGIDSSLISCLMQETSPNRINTFTIGFEDKRFDESLYAREIANTIGSNHSEVKIGYKHIQDIIQLIPEIYDEPFSDSSQLVTYLLSKFARSKVTVALSGDGGDELFGGYNRYIWSSRILSMPLKIRKILAYTLRKLSGNVVGKIEDIGIFSGLINQNYQLSDKLNKLSFLLDKDDFDQLYQNLLYNYIDYQKQNIVLNSNERNDIISKYQIPENVSNIIEKMMYFDSKIYLTDDILCKVDRASMSVGLETRIPFLDKKVIEFAWSLPVEKKVNRGRSKIILKELLSDYIPNNLINRPKMGFAVPIANWLRGPLKEFASEKIYSAINHKEEYFNSEIVISKWNEHLSGKKNWHYFLWNIIVFQLWLEYNK